MAAFARFNGCWGFFVAGRAAVESNECLHLRVLPNAHRRFVSGERDDNTARTGTAGLGRILGTGRSESRQDVPWWERGFGGCDPPEIFRLKAASKSPRQGMWVMLTRLVTTKQDEFFRFRSGPFLAFVPVVAALLNGPSSRLLRTARPVHSAVGEPNRQVCFQTHSPAAREPIFSHRVDVA